jgi:hypothetical protein
VDQASLFGFGEGVEISIVSIHIDSQLSVTDISVPVLLAPTMNWTVVLFLVL